MKLEEFMEQYLLRNSRFSENVGRLEYGYRLEKIREFFFDLQREGSVQNMSVDEARLCIRFYDEGYDLGKECEKCGLTLRN